MPCVLAAIYLMMDIQVFNRSALKKALWWTFLNVRQCFLVVVNETWNPRVVYILDLTTVCSIVLQSGHANLHSHPGAGECPLQFLIFPSSLVLDSLADETVSCWCFSLHAPMDSCIGASSDRLTRTTSSGRSNCSCEAEWWLLPGFQGTGLWGGSFATKLHQKLPMISCAISSWLTLLSRGREKAPSLFWTRVDVRGT